MLLNKLGNMYKDGEGVAEDGAKACKLYQRTMDGGHSQTARSLIVL